VYSSLRWKADPNDFQIVRTILSDSSSLNTNNIQQSAMFFLYSVGFSVGPVIGGYLVATSFRWVFAIKYGHPT